MKRRMNWGLAGLLVVTAFNLFGMDMLGLKFAMWGSTMLISSATSEAPVSVTNLSATHDGPGVIRVSWRVDWDTTATGYKVYRATRSDFAKAVLVAELMYWSSTYDDWDVAVDPTYYYWVVAVNDTGESGITGPVIGYCEEPLRIATTNLPNATEMVPYEDTMLAEMDNGNLYWYVKSDDYGNTGLPGGFDLSSDGILCGTPTQAGIYTFTLACCDSRFDIETSVELSLTVLENQNRRPSVLSTSPVNNMDVVLKDGESCLFNVRGSDPDGTTITYKWVVDGTEVQSGLRNNYRLRTTDDEPGTCHEVICYINDDLWTDIVNCRWMVYVPKEIYVDPDEGYYGLEYAIWDSTPYDTIHVPSGIYGGNIWLECPLTIIADDGLSTTTIEGSILFSEEARLNSMRAIISGFILRESRPIARGYQGQALGISSCYSNLTLERCIIVQNGVDWDDWEWWEEEYEVAEDHSTQGVIDNCTLVRCTVTGNVANPPKYPLMVNCEYDEGSIFWGNDGATNDLSDPFFVDAVNGDYRLRAISPHVINGIVTKGALDDVVSGCVISASVVGPGKLDKMTAVVDSGGTVTFSVVSGSHPLDHFEVNGEPVVSSGNTYTFSNVTADAILTAKFVSNVTFYVDAEQGNDNADGFTKETAVATLQEAIDRAVDGDTVRVADGTYASIATKAKHIVIESENGYKTTIIDGGGTERCATLCGPMYYDLFDRNTNSVLRGFTLINGWGQFGGGVI
ncbi:MAG: hypothetical protein J6334_03700, partial [Kiritimatiellae bacterium]|nr:hypothetical protein [Kiritimatiellia bacterium]